MHYKIRNVHFVEDKGGVTNVDVHEFFGGKMPTEIFVCAWTHLHTCVCLYLGKHIMINQL